jgi:multiple sugar transport system substrate-binding protein
LLPLQTFQSTFVDQAQAFTNEQGVLALPMFVDPVVMYYNRDILTSSFAVKPPETWDEVLALTKQVTKRDEAGALDVSTIAMGSFDNITHAKELIALLVFQLKGSFVGYDKDKKAYFSSFASGATQRTEAPAATAFKFYTGFVKSSSDQYTWSPSMPNDRTQFVSGKLALYFGTASEMVTLRKMNPNLNFGVAVVPQSAVQNTKVTYGNLIGVAVTKMSKQQTAALVVANQFVQKASIDTLLTLNPGYAPARREMLGQSSADDPLKTVVYRSAIISKSLLDPEPVQTVKILKQLVDRVNAGTLAPEGVPNAGDALFREVLSAAQQ